MEDSIAPVPVHFDLEGILLGWDETLQDYPKRIASKL